MQLFDEPYKKQEKLCQLISNLYEFARAIYYYNYTLKDSLKSIEFKRSQHDPYLHRKKIESG